MHLRCLSLLLTLVPMLCAADGRVLRVCADPNNMPFSNQQQQGFENKLASIVANQMHADLQYVWWSQRKSFLKHTLDAGLCDAVMGLPATMADAAETNPYYRSSYVFVSRRDRNLRIDSLLDPQLASLKIGVHVVGDNLAPPAVVLAREGITTNVVGFSLFGPYGEPNPPAALVRAVADGRVDLAIAWGPLAGYAASHSAVPLLVKPVSPKQFGGIPFAYDISMGVRKNDTGLLHELNEILTARAADVQSILTEYGVPQVR